METAKLLGQLLLSITLQILFLIPRAAIFILKTAEGLLRIVRKILEQLIKLIKEELL